MQLGWICTTYFCYWLRLLSSNKTLWILQFEFHIIFTYHETFLFFLKHLQMYKLLIAHRYTKTGGDSDLAYRTLFDDPGLKFLSWDEYHSSYVKYQLWHINLNVCWYKNTVWIGVLVFKFLLWWGIFFKASLKYSCIPFLTIFFSPSQHFLFHFWYVFVNFLKFYLLLLEKERDMDR